MLTRCGRNVLGKSFTFNVLFSARRGLSRGTLAMERSHAWVLPGEYAEPRPQSKRHRDLQAAAIPHYERTNRDAV
jgi:hypothetical protein